MRKCHRSYFSVVRLLTTMISWQVFYSLSSTLSYYVYICHQIRKNNINRNSSHDDNDDKDDDGDDHSCDAAERRNKIRAIKRKTTSADGADDNDVEKFKAELKSEDFPFTSFRQLLPKKLPTDKRV